MKVLFKIHYLPSGTERMFICGSLQELGNNNTDNAIPLVYLGEGIWVYDLILSTAQPTVFTYYYLAKSVGNRNIKIEWEIGRAINTAHYCKDLICLDKWNDMSLIENTFTTSAFQKIIFKYASNSSPGNSEKEYTHIFQAKAPLIRNTEALCLLGEGNELRNWNVENPILLHKDEKTGWWKVAVKLEDEHYGAAYKYGIYDLSLKKFCCYEQGENRILNTFPGNNSIVVINEGFAFFPEKYWRGAGVSVPVFSLRTENSAGIGEFTDLMPLIDWCSILGMKLIQVLPVNDTISSFTWKDSYPYAPISVFALHPIYLNLSSVGKLDQDHLLEKEFLKNKKELNDLPEVDYEKVLKFKLAYVRELYHSKKDQFFKNEDFHSFFENNKYWLIPYAAFSYLRDIHATSDFSEWGKYSVYQENLIQELVSPGTDHFDEIAWYYFLQYQLHNQLLQVRNYAQKNGIILKGDIPIGISRFSADAWENPSLYFMNVQVGAPPDDFSETGQNWGFPAYNWENMAKEGYKWWHQRFHHMSHYFDAFRIDGIPNFFRFWQIPDHAVQGIMGYFQPATALKITEFQNRGIDFDHTRYCKPYITENIIKQLFDDDAEWIKKNFLNCDNEHLTLKEEFNTQKKILHHFRSNNAKDNTRCNEKNMLRLFDLVSNVVFFESPGTHEKELHPRFEFFKTLSFLQLDSLTQNKLKNLCNDFFYGRQSNIFYTHAMKKLPEIKRATNMMICGEDLGLVPECTPRVMKELGILSLEVQRMSKDPRKSFFHPKDAKYLSVVTPGTHDMSTVRGWWQENRTITQQFYNDILEHEGDAPFFCEPWICTEIIRQHLYSPAMLCIIQIQDLLGTSGTLRREKPREEQINIPSIAQHYWRYRIHLKLEDLMKAESFNKELSNYIKESGR